MDLNEVKQFLRVDFTDDDNIITMIVKAAEQYIINAVGYFDEEKPLMRLLLQVLVADMYENRAVTVTSAAKQNYVVRSIIYQLLFSGGENNGK